MLTFITRLGKRTARREGSFEREFHSPRFQEELQALRSTIDCQRDALDRIAAIAAEPAVLAGFLCQTGIGIRDAEGAIPVAVVYGARDQAEPIARMMAASRELLAVAQKCEAMLTRQKWLPDGTDPEAALLREARAAIAIAKAQS